MQVHREPSLETLLAGRRGAARKPVRMPVRIKGVRGEYRATVRDLSARGALVHVPLAALQGEGASPPGPGEQFALLERHFRDSFDLIFPDAAVVVEARIVRLLIGDPKALEIALGCQFVQTLARGQQEAVGLVEPVDLPAWEEAVASHPLLREARPGRALSALLVDGEAAERGPRFIAAVSSVGERVIALELPGVGAEDVLEALFDADFSVRVVGRRGALFEAPAALYAMRYRDHPVPGVDALLLCGAGVPWRVRRRYRRLRG